MKRRQTTRCSFLLALAAACLLSASSASSGDDPASKRGIAWFGDMRSARTVAERTGRPLFVALHRLPVVAAPQAQARLAAWMQVYEDPSVVECSRAFACVLRRIPAPEGKDAAPATERSVTHLVLDGASRVLLRDDAGAPTAGGRGGIDLHTFLRRGLEAFGSIAPDAPRIGHDMVARTQKHVEGSSPLRPVGVPLDAPGLRVRLRYELPVPQLASKKADATSLRARVSMRWDGAGPFSLESVELAPGEEPDLPVDVRFESIDGLAPLLTKGTHRLDLFLEPEPRSYPFSIGPLHVGRVWIELGEGGGGGGPESNDEPDAPKPEPDQPEQPQPVPGADPDEPEPPPPSDRTEVVDPFVREGDTIKKEDAIVAVEDPDSAVKPPRRVPLEEALRDFEKVKERAVGEERIAPRDRDFLRLYFEALERAVRGSAGAAPPGKEGGK